MAVDNEDLEHFIVMESVIVEGKSRAFRPHNSRLALTKFHLLFLVGRSLILFRTSFKCTQGLNLIPSQKSVIVEPNSGQRGMRVDH